MEGEYLETGEEGYFESSPQVIGSPKVAANAG